MGNNPYVVLGLKETATAEEIRRALKERVSKYCGRDNNGKNADGEYLQTIFLQSAKDLLDPSKRAKIDEELSAERLKNGVIPYVKKNVENSYENKKENTFGTRNGELNKLSTKEENESVAMIVEKHKIKYFNASLILKSLTIIPPFIFDRKVTLADILAVIGEDGSFMFVKEVTSTVKDDYEEYVGYSLNNVFTRENCFGKNTVYSWEDRPYCHGKIFEINGIKSIALMASKFIPVNMIQRESITEDNLKNVSSCISEYLASNPQIIEGIFGESEAENSKIYYMSQPSKK